MSRYLGSFDNWADVQQQFAIKDKEPTEVILAVYDQESYEGSALVVYRQGRQYFTASGSHCSCYGLEDQWAPEAFNKRDLKAFYKRLVAGEPGWHGLNGQYAKTILENMGVAA
jgi:hypothetical protein